MSFLGRSSGVRAGAPAEGLLGQRGVFWAFHDTLLSKWLTGVGRKSSCEKRALHCFLCEWSDCCAGKYLPFASPGPSPPCLCPGILDCVDSISRLFAVGFGLGLALVGHRREVGRCGWTIYSPGSFSVRSSGASLSLDWSSQFLVRAATLSDAFFPGSFTPSNHVLPSPLILTTPPSPL